MSVFSDSEKVSLTRANYSERFFTQKISLCTLICLIYLLCHGNCLCYVRAQNTKCYRDVHVNRTAKACDNTALTKLCSQGQGLCWFSFLINFLISEFVKGWTWTTCAQHFIKTMWRLTSREGIKGHWRHLSLDAWVTNLRQRNPIPRKETRSDTAASMWTCFTHELRTIKSNNKLCKWIEAAHLSFLEH